MCNITFISYCLSTYLSAHSFSVIISFPPRRGKSDLNLASLIACPESPSDATLPLPTGSCVLSLLITLPFPFTLLHHRLTLFYRLYLPSDPLCELNARLVSILSRMLVCVSSLSIHWSGFLSACLIACLFQYLIV